MNFPAILSFACGFASLSLEILWVRLYSFAQSSTPSAFGFVLMAYLLGIAAGAHIGSRVCRRVHDEATLWSCSLFAIGLSAAFSIALPALFGAMVSNHVEDPLSAIAVIATGSAVLAFVFPIAHHLGANAQKGSQGKRFAAVYTSNVIGAALGPLATGYVLLQMFSLQQSFVVICLIQLGAVLFFAFAMGGVPFRRTLAMLSVFMTVGVLVANSAVDRHTLIQSVNQLGTDAKTVIENRHGVITLFPSDDGRAGDDAVYGGNVYDGRTNLDPERNSNGLERPLLMAALQPHPERVLMVGLSIGTWLAMINEFPGVKHVDVVEINPGYLAAAQAYPPQAKALRDPRVNMVVDDARRWLRQNKETRYDLVIMNTTWHWRANSSLLLSSEFMALVKRHMAPGAVLAFNATGSADAFFTASQVFTHAYLYTNFVYAADFDFRKRKDDDNARRVYEELLIDGQPFFAAGSTKVDAFRSERFRTVEQVQKGVERPLEEITDRNMITEFKYGRRLY